MHVHHAEAEGAQSASLPDDPLHAARELIAEEQRMRLQACAEEIQAVLAKYGMRLDVTPPQVVLNPVDAP